MANSNPQVSPALQALIDKGIFERLPVTFSTFFFDRIKDWALLFPAEKSYHERLFALLDRAPAADVDALFAPVREAERQMGVNQRNWPRGQFTLDQVDFLNRSPHYSAWRQAIAGVFARIDPMLDAEIARQGRPRLVIVLAPADLPVGPDRMWTRIAERGKRIPIQAPENGADYLPEMLTGAPRERRAPTLADLYCESRHEQLYESWLIEAGEDISALSRAGAVVRLSYARLKDYRLRLMNEVQHVVESEQIRGPRQLGARLKELRIRSGESEMATDAVLGEFARAVLLSGNGTLLINNTFVEWATMQAVRRARPSLVTIAYGIRNKVKPFSGLLIYTDQDAANPIPTQADMLGSYVDLEIFHEYVFNEFLKYPEYRGNTALLFVGLGMDEMLAIAPPDFPLLSAKAPVAPASVFGHARDWMAI